MITTARLLISVLTSALMVIGIVAIHLNSADPPAALRAAAMGMPGGVRSAEDIPSAAPAAVWTADGSRLDVFKVFGSDDRVAQRFWTGAAGWSNWLDVGAPAVGLGTGPSAVWALDKSRLDVFATGVDHHLYQNTWRATGWSGWTDLGGFLITAPGASATAGGRIDVFGLGFLDNGDFGLVQKIWTGSSWTDWVVHAEPFSGIGARPSVTWTPDGHRIDVFVVSAVGGHLHQKTWFRTTGWTDWVTLDGVLTTAPSASWANNGGRIDVFGIGTDARLYQKTWAGRWGGWVPFTPPAAGARRGPSATWTANGGRIDVLVSGDFDGRVYQMSWRASTGWTGWVDLG